MESSKKPDPYALDFETAPLSADEVERLMPAEELFAKHGSFKDKPVGRPRQGQGKQQVTLRLDNEVVDFFKAGGPGWQTRLNAELARIVRLGKKAS